MRIKQLEIQSFQPLGTNAYFCSLNSQEIWSFLSKQISIYPRFKNICKIFTKLSQYYLTKLPANFTYAFCQNKDYYEHPAWFSLENCGTQSVRLISILLCERWWSAILQMRKVKEVLSWVCTRKNWQNFTHSITFALITDQVNQTGHGSCWLEMYLSFSDLYSSE